MKKTVSVAIAVVVVGLFAYRFHQAGEEVAIDSIADVQAREGIPVEVKLAAVSDVEIWRTFSGTVEGIVQTAVSSDIGDEAVEVTRDVGDRVSAGQVLVRLARRKAVPGVGVRHKQSLAVYKNARKEVERLEALFKAGALSERQLDGARTQLEIAKADLDASVARSDIVSPISGVVVRRNVEEGDMVQPGSPLMVIAELSRCVVKVTMGARDARKLEAGRVARLSADAIQGVVRKIALSADPESRLMEVELEFPNEDAALVPGTLAVAEVLFDRALRVTSVANRAVLAGTDGSFVWVVDGSGIARRRAVAIGLTNGRVTEVREGVRPGEQVVVSGANLLEGEPKVKIVAGEARTEEG